MPTVELRSSMMKQWDPVVSTGADTASPATIGALHEDRIREWQRLINETLLRWLRDPGQLSDDGVEPLTGTILRLATDYAERFRDDGLPPPDSIVPDPNGGIVFERRLDSGSEVFYVWDDGTLEYQRFHRANLVERQTL